MIYNIRVSKFKTIINDIFDAGTHQVLWNGKDENGKSVISDIYFYKINAATKKWWSIAGSNR